MEAVICSRLLLIRSAQQQMLINAGGPVTLLTGDVHASARKKLRVAACGFTAWCDHCAAARRNSVGKRDKACTGRDTNAGDNGSGSLASRAGMELAQTLDSLCLCGLQLLTGELQKDYRWEETVQDHFHIGLIGEARWKLEREAPCFLIRSLIQLGVISDTVKGCIRHSSSRHFDSRGGDHGKASVAWKCEW